MLTKGFVARAAISLFVVSSSLAAAAAGAVTASAADGVRGGKSQKEAPISEDNRGVFSTVCSYSHSGPDDPIVHPGHAGMSHLHDFFGNVSTNASSTYASLRAATSTCRAIADESAYWVPALLQHGQPLRPESVKIYYRALGEQDAAAVEAFPAGFRMIAGDATATSAQARTVTRWTCHKVDGSAEQLPPDCPDGSTLDLHVSFPECWNGELDSADHKSHLAYGGRGACPASHPRVLPKLEMIVHYPVDGATSDLALSSGSIYSAHADFFNGWAPERLNALVTECLQATERCGPAQRVGGERPKPRS